MNEQKRSNNLTIFDSVNVTKPRSNNVNRHNLV